MTDTWTITSSPAMQAVEAAAEREHLAKTAAADQKLISDDAGPHWRAVEHAEEVLRRLDALALATVRALDEQNDARGREIQRLRAENDQLKAIDAAVLTVMDRAKHATREAHAGLPVYRLLADLAVARGLGRPPEVNGWDGSAGGPALTAVATAASSHTA